MNEGKSVGRSLFTLTSLTSTDVLSAMPENRRDLWSRLDRYSLELEKINHCMPQLRAMFNGDNYLQLSGNAVQRTTVLKNLINENVELLVEDLHDPSSLMSLNSKEEDRYNIWRTVILTNSRAVKELKAVDCSFLMSGVK